MRRPACASMQSDRGLYHSLTGKSNLNLLHAQFQHFSYFFVAEEFGSSYMIGDQTVRFSLRWGPFIKKR